MSVVALPVRYVRIPVFEALTGYTESAVNAKIRKGAWREGKHYRRAPDGHILIDLHGYTEWVESPCQVA